MTPGEAFEAFILSLLGASPGGQKIGDAQAAVRGYMDEDSTPSWKGLDKKAWCDRIIELLGNPKSFKQGNSPYCLAAACLIVLFKRTPETMADFCNALASRGKGKIKDLEIKMTKEIQGYDVPAYAKTLDVNPVDFILLLAIQNAMSPPGFFSSGIEKPEDASPAVLAKNIKDILEGTGLFTIKDIGANSSALTNQTADADIILVGKGAFFKTAVRTQRHAVVVVPPVTEVGGKVTFHYWSWGMIEADLTPGVVPHHDDHGAVDYYEQTCTSAEFSSGIGTVYVATLT